MHLHFLREPVHRAGATPTVPRRESARRRRSRERESARGPGKEGTSPLYCVILYFCAGRTVTRDYRTSRAPVVRYVHIVPASLVQIRLSREYICFVKTGLITSTVSSRLHFTRPLVLYAFLGCSFLDVGRYIAIELLNVITVTRRSLLLEYISEICLTFQRLFLPLLFPPFTDC